MSHGWTLEYRSNTGLLFASHELPSTAEVSWRRADGGESLMPTTGWTRLCGDRVWTVQDGYELLAHVGDKALVNLRGSVVDLGVDRVTDRDATAATALVGGIQCAADGGLRIQGYKFGVSDREPPLEASPVAATAFEVLLDRTGAVIGRTTKAASFDISAHCAEAANEQFGFCEAARKAVGW